jgi:hypothetical protein
MPIKGQWKRADRKHNHALQTEGGFRLIRGFSAEHNARRLSVYCQKLRCASA